MKKIRASMVSRRPPPSRVQIWPRLSGNVPTHTDAAASKTSSASTRRVHRRVREHIEKIPFGIFFKKYTICYFVIREASGVKP